MFKFALFTPPKVFTQFGRVSTLAATLAKNLIEKNLKDRIKRDSIFGMLFRGRLVLPCSLQVSNFMKSELNSSFGIEIQLF